MLLQELEPELQLERILKSETFRNTGISRRTYAPEPRPEVVRYRSLTCLETAVPC